MQTLLEAKRNKAKGVIEKYISKNKLTFKLTSVTIKENAVKSETRMIISYEEMCDGENKKRKIDCVAISVSQGLLKNLICKYEKDFKSLRGIELEEVSFSYKKKGTGEKVVDLILETRNSRGDKAAFRSMDCSLPTASANVALECTQF